jgi:magnesium transporter
MMHKAGLEVDEDLLVPVMSSARRRLFWLGLYMGTAFLAAWVIGLFEARLDQIVALAVLIDCCQHGEVLPEVRP